MNAVYLIIFVGLFFIILYLFIKGFILAVKIPSPFFFPQQKNCNWCKKKFNFRKDTIVPFGNVSYHFKCYQKMILSKDWKRFMKLKEKLLG